MRLLLDTHILLWSLADPRRLPESAREAVETGDNEILFAVADGFGGWGLMGRLEPADGGRVP